VARKRTAVSLGCLEPFVEECQRRNAVDGAPWNPHDQPGEPLVVDRIEPDPRSSTSSEKACETAVSNLNQHCEPSLENSVCKPPINHGEN